MERMISKCLLWAGLFIIGVLISLVIWDWRLFSVTLAFTGLLAVALAVLADRSKELSGSRRALSGIAHQSNRRVPRLRALLKGEI